MHKTRSPDSVACAESWRETIDTALRAYTEFGPGCPRRLQQAIRHSLLGPGKRLRPRLVELAAEATGGTIEAALPAACAVEMVHAYSLIHDDLPAMDDDQVRRGRPTCHVAFGEAVAILAGDALLALAFEVMARDVRPAETAARCCAELAHAAGATALVGGQADDLGAVGGTNTIEQLESIHHRKTGAMFRASLRIGGLCAGAGGWQLEALDAFGTHLGLAFQITDDLLDLNDRHEAGAAADGDAECGRPSYPGVLGREASRQRVAQLVELACEALTPLAAKAEKLVALTRTVSRRDH